MDCASLTSRAPRRKAASCSLYAGLEGSVSKRKHLPCKSGKGDWVKVKCAQIGKNTFHLVGLDLIAGQPR